MLSERERRALADVDRNYGAMWEPDDGYAARLLWDELKRKGLVGWNPWAERYLPSLAGRRALKEQRGGNAE
jgi:hypothetical protein